MKKLYDGVQRFCAMHPRFGIPNLMRVIVCGNVAVYVLMLLTQSNDVNALSFLTFNLNALLHGEVWRLVTFVFVPGYASPFALLIGLYFYYWIGSTLEQQWGTAKFNLYYFSGMLLTVLGTVAASLISGNYYLTVAGTTYVNLSMFFAFAFLFPNAQVLLFFIIPVRMKWLAYLDGALFAFHRCPQLGGRGAAGGGSAELRRVHLAGGALSQGAHPAAHLLPDGAVPAGAAAITASGAAAGAAGLSPQMRRVRQNRHGLPRYAVPLLQQMRRLPLLLSGSHLQPRTLHRGVKPAGAALWAAPLFTFILMKSYDSAR